jgi:YVTN family beta-propeller protein
MGEFVDGDGNVTGTFTWGGTYITGGWLSDNSGAAGSLYNFALTTDDNGNGFVSSGRVYANWSSSITWGNNPSCNGYSIEEQDFAVNPLVGISWICPVPEGDAGGNVSTNFVLPGAAPSTLTGYGDFSTTYGNPQLRVYVGGTTPSLVITESASAVMPGVSATFPFPTQSNGSALAEGFYALVNTNVASGGGLVLVSPSYLAVGGTTTLSNAFGVDAADIKYRTTACTTKGCTTIRSDTAPAPILTQYYGNSIVSYTGATIPVGSEPVAIKAYGSVETETSNGGLHYYTTGPTNAIVANSGSSSVSIVSFSTNTDVANIAVGAQPMALTLNSANTMAYVASCGNGTLAEINLSTEAVTRTVSGLSGALSVAMDPGGSYVWVGGTNYLYKVSLSTFTVVQSVPVSGGVTSLAVSNAQNELVYTLVQNCCSASSTYAANELLLSNLSNPGTYAHATAAPYAPYTMNGTLPTAAVLPQATNVVSARFSNGMGASSTPTGFVIYDLVSHKQIMADTTPTPVRGIAADPDCMFVYLTLPDSNEYIAVPLESTP